MKTLSFIGFAKVGDRMREFTVKIRDQFCFKSKFMIMMAFSIFLFSGCAYYKVTSKVPKNDVSALKAIVDKKYSKSTYPRKLFTDSILVVSLFQQNPVYAIDSTGRWLLSGATLQGDTLACNAILSPMPLKSEQPAEYRKSKRYKSKYETYYTRRVNIYLEKLEVDDEGRALFLVSDISSYDIYKHNSAKTMLIGLGIFTSALATTAAVILIISGGPDISVSIGP